ncbi:sulfatase [Dyadobacter subterraneus]|uniref:Sulfatase n=1 Tax=Dyadobacter subterraneus TaxID=2773304 RepID=A0ABR9WEQ7_9BACT|nr:sulfatase [Dyadobacter subterraneus]MBE9463980.1 sulfatase [Dyadobacter subterraneus]
MKLKYLLFINLLLWISQSGFGQNVKPNIVFVMADDLGYTDLSCYGNPYHRTPNIDSLAKKGLKFTQAYSACPVCSPSRAAIMTGKYPARLHLTNFIAGERKDPRSNVLPAQWTRYLASSEITLAEILKDNGYKTGIVGKWHLGSADSSSPVNQGFEYDRVIAKNGLDYYNYSITSNGKTVFEDHGKEYLTDKLTDYAVEYINESKSKPFFLYLTYSAPHVMLIPRADKLNYYFSNYAKYKDKFNPNYAAMLESMDDGVGRVVAELAKNNLLENTIIIFTSDNGGLGLAELGPVPTNLAPLRKWKGHVYEGGIKIPLIFSWKGNIKENMVTNNTVIGTDYVSTFCELLGINQTNKSGDGKSFYPVLKSPGQVAERGAIFWHYPHFSNQEGRPSGAVRLGNYKLVESYETGKLELFNLENDISESKDLSAKLPSKTKELAQLLKNWRKQVNANMPEINPDYSKK